jgi:hypothetical protein
MSNWSDGGSDWGGSFSQVGRNPRRKEYEDSKAEGKQVRAALSEPDRPIDAIDVLMDGGALDRAVDMATSRRARENEEKIRREAVIQARAMAPYLRPENDSYGVTQAEREEMDAYLDDEETEDDTGWEIAWR